MKKSWVLGLFVLAGLSLYVLKAWADGSFVQAPGPVISATGQNYYYPAAAAPQGGGTLVNDGTGTFRWSNSPVTTGNASNAFQLLAITSMTLTQVAQTSPTVVGQLVYCGNCADFNNGRGMLCVSTTSLTAQNSFIAISSAATASVCK